MIALLAASAWGRIPVFYETTQGEDWCGVIAGAIGDDVVELAPGDYTGPCAIVAKPSEIEVEQTTVEGLDPTDPPRFHAGTGDSVLQVSGHRLILLGLLFEDLPAGVDAVRVDGLRELWIDGDAFRRFPGAAVRMRGGVEQRFEVHATELTDLGLGVEIGCADGSCGVGAFEVFENLADGTGTAFVVAPGAAGTLHDDVIVGADTAIRLLGGEVTVDGELLEGTGPVLDVAAGPLLVRSSVLIGSQTVFSAPGARDVTLVGDTLLGPLDLSGWGTGRNLRLAGSALDRDVPDLDGVDLIGTVGCPDAALCWTDAAAWNVYPAEGSPLRGAGVAEADLPDDWCGRGRALPPSAGALEAVEGETMGPLAGTFKTQVDCTLSSTTTTPIDTAPPDTVTTPGSGTTVSTRPTPAPKACGCASTPGGAGLLALLLAPWRRKRRN